MTKRVVLDAAVSFWGGFDIANGTIAEGGHPNDHQYCGDCELYLPALKGSTAAPGALLEWFRLGNRPFTIITPRYEPAIAIAVNLYNQLFAEEACGIDYRVSTNWPRI